MKLNEYLDGMRAATTAAELEAALHAPFRHGYSGRTWATICRVREACGHAICDGHPLGQYIPQVRGGVLSVCGKHWRVGHRAADGPRFTWHEASALAKAELRMHGFSQRAAYRMWDALNGYPHRGLAIASDALAGKMPDPPMNRLVFSHLGTAPINYRVEDNDADDHDHRASRPCRCGGTRFDWGSGFCEGFTTVNWRCNKCPRVYVEHVTTERLAEIRQRVRITTPGMHSCAT